jgi:phosphoglycolate phosphatase
MRYEPRFRLIVFDLDGTLIDSRRDLADAVNALLAELDAPPLPEDRVARMVGEGAAVLVRRALAASGRDPALPGALDRFLALYDDRLTVHTRPYDGIIDVLEALRGVCALAVVTNKPSGATGQILAELRLDEYFRAVLGGDSPYGRKPDPAGLLHVVALAGTEPAATLLVGDSPVDLETARRAGTSICVAAYGFGFVAGTPLRPGELTLDRPEQLLTALR